MKIRHALIPLIAAVPAQLAAQQAEAAGEAEEGLDISGSVRLRHESIDGQARAGFNSSDELVNLRTTVLARYRQNNWRAVVHLFDSRVWGGNAGTPINTSEINTIEPVEAYLAADFDNALGQGSRLTLTAGRMMLNLGSRRLVAADDYRNTTNGYTGLRADLSLPQGWKGTLLYTLPQARLPDDEAGLAAERVRLDRESFELVLWGGQISKARALGRATGELTFFHLGERDGVDRPTRDRSLNTFGGRIIAEPLAGAWDYEVEALYQLGEASVSLAPNAVVQPVSAGFLHADLGYSFAGSGAPRLSAEFDLASGDKAGGRYGRFDTLFGMRRPELAPSGLYSALSRSNLMMAGFRIEAAPTTRWDWLASYHALWLHAGEDSFSGTNVRDPSGQAGNFAGHQLDVRLRYWVIPARLRFEFDGVLLAKGRFLREAPNAPAGDWTRYLSFNMTAMF